MLIGRAVLSFAWIFPVAFLLAGSDRADGQVVFRGPYLNDVTSDAITVVWETPTATTGVVRYGIGAWTHVARSVDVARHHEVRLSQLSSIGAPGSEFVYQVQTGTNTASGSFKTAVLAGAPFRFVVYGDNRSAPAQHEVVVRALMRESPRPHFIVNTGDLVSNGEAESNWDLFFPVAAPLVANFPMFVAIGNHEVDLGQWNVTKRLFVMPINVAPASNNEGFYHVVYGNVELIVINVEVDSLYTVPLLSGEQEDWLKEVLAHRPQGVQHRFVATHEGPYSSKVGRNGNFWLRRWLDDFKAAGVDIIFSGHDHYAERGWAKNGVWYVVHGGGGAPLYNTMGPRTLQDHTVMYSASRLGYALVEVDGPKARVSVKGLAGEVLDAFSYGDSAAPACSVASDCPAPPITACPQGAWECHRSACRYTCPEDSGGLVQCWRDSDCVAQIGSACPGTPTCEHPSTNPTYWYCQCTLPPECGSASDCANRPSPLPGCTGTWGCVDEQCEFTADLCVPVVDAGVSDAASALDAGREDARADAGNDATADATSALADVQKNDAPAFPDAEPNHDATAASDKDAGAIVDAHAVVVPGEKSGCGCRANATPFRSGTSLTIAAFIALFVVRLVARGPLWP